MKPDEAMRMKINLSEAAFSSFMLGQELKRSSLDVNEVLGLIEQIRERMATCTEILDEGEQRILDGGRVGE